MFLEGIVIIISLVVSIRSTLLQVMTKIPVQNDIIIIIPIYNFRVDTQDVGKKREVQPKVGLKSERTFTVGTWGRKLRGADVSKWACLCAHGCVCAYACVCLCICESAGSFKGPNITQIKTCILLFMGWLFVPVSLEQLCEFVCVCEWVWVRVCMFVRRGARERKLQQPGDKYLHSSKHRRTVLCSLLFIQRERVFGGGTWKHLKSCAFLCVCVLWPLRSAPNIHNECLSPYWPPHQKHE